MPLTLTYNNIDLSETSPAVLFSNQPVYIDGEYQYDTANISINGIITGSDIQILNDKRREIITGLAQEFKTLTVDTGVYDFVKVNSVSFQDSDYNTILPYSIEMSYYEDPFNGIFSGVADPVDSWAFEEENKVITATHNISAKGIKRDGNRPIDLARNFVAGRRAEPIQSAIFNKKQNESYHLLSTVENIDDSKGTYSITDVYKFHEEGSYDYGIGTTNTGIVSCSLSLEVSEEGKVSASVNGNIKGPLSGDIGLISGFNGDKAKDIALEYLSNSKGQEENYSIANLNVDGFSYTVNENANDIQFSFSLIQEDETELIDGEILHKYGVDFSISKDGNSFITANVNGSLEYVGTGEAVQEGEYEDSYRWGKISGAFDQITPYDVALTRYNQFKPEISGIYGIGNTTTLNTKEDSLNINKDLEKTSISYSYIYSDKFDFGAGTDLKNLQVRVTDKLPLTSKTRAIETMAGFQTQIVSSGEVGLLQVDASSSNESGLMPDLIQVADSFFDKGFFVKDSSKNIGVKDISCSISKYYD
jgi:hypothetical protein